MERAMQIEERRRLREQLNARSSSRRYVKLQTRKGKSGGGSSGSGGKTSSGQPESSSGGTTSKSKFTLPSLGNSGSRGAAPFSSGGGPRLTVPQGSVFQGRQIGGGTRDQVYGGPRYGSGYPYGGGGSYLGGRAFPFGFWPLYWGPHYYGGDEYGPERNNSRPGGNMTTVRLTSSTWTNVANLATNTSAPLLYPFSLIGDFDTLSAVMDVLVSSDCAVANATIVPYDTTNTTQPKPQNVVQYYRSSSFALALDGYNNTAELPSNMPPNNDTSIPANLTDTPLPTNHTDMSFLSCVNETIGESLPILDSAASVAFLLRGQMSGFIGLFWLFVLLFRGFF